MRPGVETEWFVVSRILTVSNPGWVPNLPSQTFLFRRDPPHTSATPFTLLPDHRPVIAPCVCMYDPEYASISLIATTVGPPRLARRMAVDPTDQLVRLIADTVWRARPPIW
jgi:hypothetical protein